MFFDRCLAIFSRPSQLIAHCEGVTLESPYSWQPHQWRNGSTLKAGRREVPDSIPSRACRPSRLDFYVIFSETRVNTGYDPVERPLRRARHL